MNNNNPAFNRSFDDASFKIPDSQLGLPAGANARTSAADPMSAFPATDDALDKSQQNLFRSARRQSVPHSFHSDNQTTMDTNLRRVSTMDFATQQSANTVNPFAFDPSLAALDPALTGDMQMQVSSGVSQKSNVPMPDLSVDIIPESHGLYAPPWADRQLPIVLRHGPN
jgi:hypothetical protein